MTTSPGISPAGPANPAAKDGRRSAGNVGRPGSGNSYSFGKFGFAFTSFNWAVCRWLCAESSRTHW